MTVKILLLLTGLAVASKDCEQADFEQPQPEGAKNLKTIPSKLRGKYMSLSDSTMLEITDKAIIQQKTFSGSIGRDELDSAEQAHIKSDTAYCDESGCYDFDLVGDSIEVKVSSIDTLLYLSGKGDKGLMRKYGKFYFVNKQKGPQHWEVRKLEPGKNELTISSTYAKEDIAFLRKQLKTSDSALVFNPTKSQFKQFVNEGGFRNRPKYRRL